jgi:formylglycine-generating enzyme
MKPTKPTKPTKPMKPMMAVAALGLALGIMATTDLHADTFGSGANTFTIDFVTVGDPGNPNDSGTTGSYFSPYGGVASEFRMGTYEVSRDAITKANAQGSLGITLADMTSFGGNGVNRPATGVSWNEAARFVNWLNTSNGFSAAYKFTLQPGDVGYNANVNIELWTSGDAGYDASNLYRNANAYYYLPSEDEWYKAAYYSGTGSTYFDYATQQDAPSTPTAVSGGTGANEAVYAPASAPGPADIDNAGGLSHYGTMGQNGNVWEWNESAFTAPNDPSSEDRAIRGGGWVDPEVVLRSSGRGYGDPAGEGFAIGFRVASVPEPSAALLVLMAGGAWLLRRRASRSL